MKRLSETENKVTVFVIAEKPVKKLLVSSALVDLIIDEFQDTEQQDLSNDFYLSEEDIEYLLRQVKKRKFSNADAVALADLLKYAKQQGGTVRLSLDDWLEDTKESVIPDFQKDDEVEQMKKLLEAWIL